MNKLPLVTIITPSFNQAAYLPAACNSVVSQNYPNIEYFIVDGGSSDGSAMLIQKWASAEKSRIAWWVSEKDKGQADAINKGFLKAKGEIIAWLNSDDLYMQGAIEKAVTALKKNPDAGLVFSNVFSIDGQDKLINVMRYGEWGKKDLMAFNIIGQPGVFMRKSALDAAGLLDASYHCLLDHHLWLRIAEKHDIKYVDDFFAAARFHPLAKNIARPVEFSREAFRIVDWMKSRPGLAKTASENRRKILAGAYRFSARYLLDGGKNRQAIGHYLKSFWLKPKADKNEIFRFFYSLFGFLMPIKKLKLAFFEQRLNQLSQDKMDMLYKHLSDFNAANFKEERVLKDAN